MGSGGWAGGVGGRSGRARRGARGAGGAQVRTVHALRGQAARRGPPSQSAPRNHPLLLLRSPLLVLPKAQLLHSSLPRRGLFRPLPHAAVQRGGHNCSGWVWVWVWDWEWGEGEVRACSAGQREAEWRGWWRLPSANPRLCPHPCSCRPRRWRCRRSRPGTGSRPGRHCLQGHRGHRPRGRGREGGREAGAW